jgi:LuxR family transcriptional regulator, quorum-sensing system regulator SolR
MSGSTIGVMKPWQVDQWDFAPNSRTPEQLFQRFVIAARQLGFEFCAYGTRLPLPVTKPRIITFNNYPLEWRRLYVERDYLNIDPTVRLGSRSSVTLMWSDELFASCPRMWEEAQSYGLRYGWCRSCFDSNGIGGLLTLARSSGPIGERELRDKAIAMDWMTQSAHTAMTKCLMHRLIPECTAKLSTQELTVLRWTGEGYCSREIAQLMNIAERTVNFHATNATAKLNASNKTAAVMRAAVLGLLY